MTSILMLKGLLVMMMRKMQKKNDRGKRLTGMRGYDWIVLANDVSHYEFHISSNGSK